MLLTYLLHVIKGRLRYSIASCETDNLIDMMKRREMLFFCLPKNRTIQAVEKMVK